LRLRFHCTLGPSVQNDRGWKAETNIGKARGHELLFRGVNWRP
jgi:hypothetical protein